MTSPQRAYSNVELHVEALRRVGWQSAVDGVEPQVCDYFSSRFFARMHEAEAASDVEAAAIFCLFGSITSLMLQAPKVREPFAPAAIFSTGRSFMPEDLSANHWQVLGEIVGDITHPELHSRVADVLWVGKRNAQMARVAVDSYLRSAAILDSPERWVYPHARIERALRLATMIRDHSATERVFDFIKQTLDKYNGTDPSYFSLRLLELLVEFKDGNADKYAALAAKIATLAAAQHDWRRARLARQIEAKWHARREDASAKRGALIAAAETYVREASDSLAQAEPNYFGASISLRDAVEALRRIPGTKKRAQELHARLLMCQEKSVGTMTRIGAELDVADLAPRAESAVTNKPLHEALIALALIGGTPRVDQLREQVLQQAKDFPLSHLVPAYVLAEDGRVAGARSGATLPDLSGGEEFVRSEMLVTAHWQQITHTLGFLEPARRRINLEHRVQLNDLLPFFTNHPFVPAGRELLYARGMLAGFDGDFDVAASLLVPQIEQSIRFVVAQRGIIVSKLKDGVQDVMDLNDIFWSYWDELQAIFNKDIAFDLRGLLVERSGTNLRNRFAHGLMSAEQLGSVDSMHLWWLTLHIVVMARMSSPVTTAEHEQRDEGDHERDPE